MISVWKYSRFLYINFVSCNFVIFIDELWIDFWWCLIGFFFWGGGFPGGSEVKASAWNVGDPGLIPELGKIPWRRKWQPTLVLLPGESHGGRSLVGYSPWGHKESDMTEWLHLGFFTYSIISSVKSDSFTSFQFGFFNICLPADFCG